MIKTIDQCYTEAQGDCMNPDVTDLFGLFPGNQLAFCVFAQL